MTRKDILDSALKCVNGDRDLQYGNPENSFKIIAELWNAYIKGANPSGITDTFGLSYADVAAMLALMKIARIAGGTPKEDNWIDLAGYAACGGELEGILLEKKKTMTKNNCKPISLNVEELREQACNCIRNEQFTTPLNY